MKESLREIDGEQLIRGKLSQGRGSPVRAYRDLTVGQQGLARLFLYELLTCALGPMPGGAGIFLRRALYPVLLRRAGRGLIIGRNVVIRHPDKIELGDHVAIDDGCLIDARGAGPEGVVLEDQVLVNRNCMIQAKAGPIRIGRRTSIGSNSVIVSMDGVELGEAVLLAGGCYLSAGGYHFEDIEAPVMDQGAYTRGPIRIGDKAWLGTCCVVLDGVTIGAGAVLGAGAVAAKDIPDNAVAVGVPAKSMRKRGGQSLSGQSKAGPTIAPSSRSKGTGTLRKEASTRL